eukprot:3342963-Amphidinium_carterae.1
MVSPGRCRCRLARSIGIQRLWTIVEVDAGRSFRLGGVRLAGCAGTAASSDMLADDETRTTFLSQST